MLRYFLLFLLLFFPLCASDAQLHYPVLDWKGYFSIFVFFLVFFCMLKEYFPPDIIMLVGASTFLVLGFIEPKDFLMGFSQEMIISLAMLCVLARSLELNGILNLLVNWVLPKTKNYFFQMAAMTLPLGLVSAFLNNTPIVLMFTPLVRKWALKLGKSPSKFLIPLSYATMFGGTCTLIGNSCNLMIDGMLRAVDPRAGLDFFELSLLALPAAILGFFYLFFLGPYLLPDRIDVATAAKKQSREFSGVFLVRKKCPLANKSIADLRRKYLRGENLVEIERGAARIDAPTPDEVIYAGDRLIFTGGFEELSKLHKIEGLRSLEDVSLSIDFSSSHFAEVVISPTSSLIGKTLQGFRRFYGASVLAVYRQGKRVDENMRKIILEAGDTLMLLSAKPWDTSGGYHDDIYYIKNTEQLPQFHPVKGYLVLLILLCMVLAASSGIRMMTASLCAVFALASLRCISIRQARQSIRWDLLVLIASAFSFGKALENTAVAEYLAVLFLQWVGSNEFFLIFTIFTTTLIVTEMITNNAAALLIFPIALQMARHSGFDSPEAIRAIGVTIALSASYSFASPIGYQTNTIVYGPGGYKFVDYVRIGLPLCFLLMIFCVCLIPIIWPLR